MTAGLLVACIALTAFILGLCVGAAMVTKDYHKRVSDNWLPYIASDDGIVWRKRS